MRRHAGRSNRGQIKHQKAIIAEGNNIGLLYRHKPQYCGLNELQARDNIALYVYKAAIQKIKDPATGISSICLSSVTSPSLCSTKGGSI